MAKILLVDDDPVSTKVVTFLLRSEGHSVTCARDGYTALEMLKGGLPCHMVITEVSLAGGFSGYRLANALKRSADWKMIPVIVLTARSGRADVARARRSGVVHFFVKPFETELFRAKVTEILARHSPAAHVGYVDVSERGLWTTLFRVTGVSEQGIRIESLVPLPLGFQLCFASNVFARLGLTTPTVRVTECEETRSGGYVLLLAFADLPESELLSVRSFINKQKIHSAA